MNVALSFLGCHRRGGVERIVFECARFLDGRGHRVTVFANEWEADPHAPSLEYQFVPIARRPSFRVPRSFFRACTARLHDAEFDVHNAHGCVCPTGGVHWVQSVHAAWLEQSAVRRPALSAARWRQRLNPIHRALLDLERTHFRERRYRKLIVPTECVRSDLHRLYGVPPADAVVIPNGFAPNQFNAEHRLRNRDAMRRRLGLAPDDVALLFVANELERKGYRTILAAMQNLADPRVRLLVVGRVSPALVRSLAADAGVADKVVACGPTADVASYHAAADVFVLPTQYEAFCLAILEALASGVPVVTSAVPGAADAIRPGGNGSLVHDPMNGEELAEALRPLIADLGLRAAWSAAAPMSVERYRWPAVLAQYERVLLDHAASGTAGSQPEPEPLRLGAAGAAASLGATAYASALT